MSSCDIHCGYDCVPGGYYAELLAKYGIIDIRDEVQFQDFYLSTFDAEEIINKIDQKISIVEEKDTLLGLREWLQKNKE